MFSLNFFFRLCSYMVHLFQHRVINITTFKKKKQNIEIKTQGFQGNLKKQCEVPKVGLQLPNSELELELVTSARIQGD